MYKKILIISGPTATGKTNIAIKLAKKFNGELISADSRQIYKGMDIGTGKDHPKNIKINLIDIINPNESFSVAQYRELALKSIDNILSKGKLPIIVGGTGQYVESIINPRETFDIKPNYFLRFFLDRLSVNTLQRNIIYFANKIKHEEYFLFLFSIQNLIYPKNLYGKMPYQSYQEQRVNCLPFFLLQKRSYLRELVQAPFVD